MKLIIFLLINICILNGCARTMWVSEESEEGSLFSYKSVAGIPFYTKKEVFDQTTTYSQSWMKVTLKVNKKLIDKSGTETKIIGNSSQEYEKNVVVSEYSKFDKIKSEIIAIDKVTSVEANKIITDFQKIKGITDYGSIESVLIGNIVKSVWVVNSESEYFLNAPLPWFGSSNLTQEINDNGTLSKATSNPDTKLAEGITSLIPIKDFLSKKFIPESLSETVDTAVIQEIELMAFTGIPKPKSSDKDKLEVAYELSISAAQTGYIYSFTKRMKKEPKSGKITFDIDNGIFSRSIIESNIGLSTKDKKDGSKKIGLSGTIVLPKDWNK